MQLGHSEDKPTAPRTKTGLAIYLTCILVILLFAASNMMVLNSASRVADEVRLTDERRLLENEFSRQIDIVARDQSQISHWNATLIALEGEVDREFVREEIAGWLWGDFDILTTAVIGPDGNPRVSVRKSAILAPKTAMDRIRQNADLIERAHKLYEQHRTPYKNGFRLENDPVASETPIFSSDIRVVDGEISIVIAQAIVSHDNFVLPPGAPHILLTQKPFNEGDLALVAKKIGVKGLQFLSASDGLTDASSMMSVGSSGLQVFWEKDTPSSAVWKNVLPPVIIVTIIVGLGLLLVSVRYWRMLSSLQASEARNRFLAMHDALTGLPNRHQFDRELEAVISRGDYDRCAILCLDLDRFKSVNDVYGHHAGDAVIRAVASRLAETVGDSGLAARIGGDEFIILLRNGIDVKSVEALCTEIIQNVCEPVSFDGGTSSVGASIGAAWWPDDAKTGKMVIRSADEALYRAKERGRGRAVFATELRKSEGRASEAA